MLRSSIGISKLSVSEEIDPGFGPDTEQRRVEFASKMEEEAFNISLGDATKLAKANLITALKLWKRKHLIPLIEKLVLRDIMLIWLFFEVSYLYEIFKGMMNKEKVKLIIEKDDLNKFLRIMFSALHENIKPVFNGVNLDLENIRKLREAFGGDLIFSLKLKNDYEMLKIYEFCYSKLPQSLRDSFFRIITGVVVDNQSLREILLGDSEETKKYFFNYIQSSIERSEDYVIKDDCLHIIAKIVSSFDTELSDMISKYESKSENEKKQEVKNQVKKFYGLK